jgi:hypothetical protein
MKSTVDTTYCAAFSENRYTIWDIKQRELNDMIQAKKITKRYSNAGVDYVPSYIRMFENELYLRKHQPGSFEHVFAIMYTTAVFNNDALTGTPVYVPRLDFYDVHIMESDEKEAINPLNNYYIMNSGRLVMNNLKTGDRYKHDHVLNTLSQKYIRLSLRMYPRTKLFPQPRDMLYKMTKKVLGIGNKEYRKAFQNIYEKVFQIPIQDMSKPLGHDVLNAQISYLDNYKYTDDEVKIYRIMIEKQVMFNAIDL